MKRAGVFVIYHAKGEIDRSVQYYLSKLTPFLDRLVIVVNGNLADAGRAILLNFSKEVYQRENVGYDVGAFQFGIQTIGFETLKEYDELIVANDSVFGPVYPLEELFETMEDRKELDFWGVTGQLEDKSVKFKDNPKGYMLSHIQSYFTVFNKEILCSSCFEEYWSKLPIMKNKEQAIGLHETYVTDYFTQHGYQWDVYVPMKDRNGNSKNVNMIYCKPVLCMKEYRCPFIKKMLFSQLISCDFQQDEIKPFLIENTDYDVSLIFEHIVRSLSDEDLLRILHDASLYSAIKESRSYRITKPLRDLFNIARKIKRSIARIV